MLLTRPPLIHFIFTPKGSVKISSLDLHVLSAPPAFVLSQDQTLILEFDLSSFTYRVTGEFRSLAFTLSRPESTVFFVQNA